MAFCGNCGAQIPEGMKFCTNCGMPVGGATQEVDTTKSEIVKSNTDFGVYQARPVKDNVQKISFDDEDKQLSPIDKYGKFIAIGVFVLAIITFNSDPPIVTILLSAAVIAGAVFCINKKYKFKALSVISVIIAVICILCGVFQAKKFGLFKIPSKEDYSSKTNTVAQEPEQPRKDLSEYANGENYRVVPKTQSASATKSTDTSDEATEASEATEDNALETGGVDPDLKAFLDSYEKFMDEYIEFMQDYMNNPTDMALLGQYADMLQKYSDFEQKADKYDSNNMSTADAAYYLEVTNRINQKMLKIYSN